MFLFFSWFLNLLFALLFIRSSLLKQSIVNCFLFIYYTQFHVLLFFLFILTFHSFIIILLLFYLNYNFKIGKNRVYLCDTTRVDGKEYVKLCKYCLVYGLIWLEFHFRLGKGHSMKGFSATNMDLQIRWRWYQRQGLKLVRIVLSCIKDDLKTWERRKFRCRKWTGNASIYWIWMPFSHFHNIVSMVL